MDSESDAGREPASHPEIIGGPLLVAIILSASSHLALVVVAVACLLLAFLCALFENALHEYSDAKLKEEAKQRGIDEAIDKVLLDEDRILFASKVGRGLFQVVGIAVLVVAFVQSDPTDLAAVGWSVLVATLFLLVNVSAPYVLGWRFGDSILLRWLLPYTRVVRVLFPVASLMHKAAERLTGSAPEPDPDEETRDEILSAVEEGRREGTLGHSEKRMIEGVIELRDETAEHIMTPRTEMVCIPVGATAQEAIEASHGRGLSRLPVFRESQDDIAGILYVKDLLPYLGQEETPSIERIMRKPIFVPHSKNIRDLFQEMRSKRIHLAIVVDEYGGTAGVVTMEDILEEIVGEIADEHETQPAEEVVRVADNVATVEGRTHIDELNRVLELDVPESEEYETVGGLLFSRMGRVPATGEQLDVNGVRFTILDADERRIQRVKVTVERE